MAIREAELQKTIGALSDGQREIRGVTLEPRSNWSGKTTENVTFTKVDFSAPLMGGLLSRPVFRRCIFRQCNLDGINAKNTEFADCTFDDTALGRDLAGNLTKCAFRGCAFRKCNLFAIFMVECRFENCDFSANRMKKLNFQRSVFSSTKFSGVLLTVNFTKCEMRDCNFSDAELVDCAFEVADWSGITMPDRPDNFVVDPQMFVRAKDVVRGKLSALAYERYAELADYMAGSDLKREIVHKELFEDLPDEEAEVVQKTLYELSRSAS